MIRRMVSSGSALAAALRARIEQGSARVGVIGLGYVGLPLALAFAESGMTVLGFDVDGEKVAALARGEPSIRHPAAGRLAPLVATGTLVPTGDFGRLGEADAVLICVPTPLTPEREPDLTYVAATGRQIAATLRPGQLVVLESTTYPGTTDELLRGLLEASGLRCGEGFFLAFSPERENPATRSRRHRDLPKVVGGVDEASAGLAAALYARVVPRVVRVSSARAAEATKLTENIFRAVNIALVNELKVIYDSIGDRHLGGARRRGDEALRLHALQPRPGLGRPLHPARSLLPGMEGPPGGAADRLHRARRRGQRADARLRGREADPGARRARQAGRGERHPGAGDRLQARPRRLAGEPGLRHHRPPAAAGRPGVVPRPLHPARAGDARLGPPGASRVVAARRRSRSPRPTRC